MGILKDEPHQRIASADELLAIAQAMEIEAGRRYRELAAHMQKRGEEQLARLFAFLAELEDKHAQAVEQRAQAVTGRRPDPESVRWQLPENFDDEDARSNLLTPFRALAIAVRNEERAFAFFAYLAANATDERLRKMAEECASDELEHAALLRRERRRAWRSEGGRHPRRATAEEIRSAEELWAWVAAMERCAADGHSALSATLAAGGERASARLFAQAAEEEAALADAATARAGGMALARRSEAPPKTVRQGLALLEAAFERYADLAEHTDSEAIVQEAQQLAAHALRRLTYTQGAIDNSLMAIDQAPS